MNRRLGAFDFTVEDPLDAKPREYAYGFSDLLLFLSRRWILITAITAAVIILAGAVLVKIQPSYTATAELTLIDQRQQRTPIADLLTGVPLSRQLVEQEITTMRSKAFMIEVVKRLQIESDAPIFEAAEPPILPVRILRDVKKRVSSLLRPASVPLPQEVEADQQPPKLVLGETDAQGDTVNIEANSPTQEAAFIVLAADLQKYGDTADQLAGVIQIAQRGNGYVIGMSAQSADPLKAAKIANTAAAEYTRFSLEIRGDAIEEQVKLLSDRVEELGKNLEVSETAVVDFQEQVMGVNNSSVDRLSRQIEDLSRRLVDARADIVRADAQYQKVLDILSKDGAMAAADVLTSQILVSVRSELSQLRIERSRAIERFGSESSQVSALDAIINRITKEVEIETTRVVGEYETELNIAQTIANSIRTELASLETAMLSRTRNMVELSKLRRIADANRIAYEEFLTIATESAQYKALQQPTVRLLSYAEVPKAPSSPRTLLLLATSVLTGLAIGTGIAILIEAMNNNIKTSRQLRSVSGLPVIGSFTKISAAASAKFRNKMLTGKGQLPSHTTKLLSAEGHAVASFLMNALDRERGTIVVTSAVPDEASSIVAFQFADALSSRSESVLLLDTVHQNMRRTTKVPEPTIPTAEDVRGIKKTASGFDILILSDATRTDPSLLPERWKLALMKEITAEYDYVVIDTPPILTSAGALGFVRDADAILIASRWNSTARQTIEACVQRLADLKAQNMYMVMTQVKRRVEQKYEYPGFKKMLKARKLGA